LRTNLHSNFFTIDYKSLGLKIGFPDFFGMALRKADIVAILFAFAGKFAFVHRAVLYLFLSK